MKLPRELSSTGLQPDLSHWKCSSTPKSVSVKKSIIGFYVYGLLMIQYQMYLGYKQNLLGLRFRFWCGFPLPRLLILKARNGDGSIQQTLLFGKGFYRPDHIFRLGPCSPSSFHFPSVSYLSGGFEQVYTMGVQRPLKMLEREAACPPWQYCLNRLSKR